MRILLIHNNYGKTSGEEIMFNRIAELLRFYGHTVECFCRSSAEISSVFNKVSAFFSGIYSFQSRTAFRRVLEKRRPDVAYVQNVFPLISPSVLGECRRAGIPVVMTVHNYRLVCPNGLHMVHGQVCEKCCGGKEYWCLLKNWLLL